MHQFEFNVVSRANLTAATLSLAALLGSLASTLTPFDAVAASTKPSKKPVSCAAVFKVQSMDVARQAQEGYQSHNVEAFEALENLKRSWPNLAEKRPLMEAIKELLADESLSTFHIFLKDVVTTTATELESGDSTQKMNKLKQNLRAHLEKFMRPSDAAERVALLEGETLTKAQLMRALGHQTAEETLLSLVGPRGISNPSADSLVGRYISRARSELGVDVATHLGKFDQGPDEGAAKGPERLYLAVDQRTLQLANEIFVNNPHHMLHNHDHGQGTLEVLAMGGRKFYYSENYGAGRIYHGENTILPLITLSTTEASNVQNYADLGSIEKKFSKYAWNYGKVSVNGEVKKNYCEVGGYGSCTHWWFEMPIGDKLVKRLRFPKHNGDDTYGRYQDDSAEEAEARTKVREIPVGRYTHFISSSGNLEIGQTERRDRLIRSVWGQGQSHMQLWQMIGLPKATLDDGSGANPGWVLYSILGKASSERVPVVLVVRGNASSPLTPETLQELKTTIHPK